MITTPFFKSAWTLAMALVVASALLVSCKRRAQTGAAAVATAAGTESDATPTVEEPNLPPVGSQSLFDSMIADYLSGHTGLPSTFTDLIAMTNAFAAERGRGALIGLSRSAQSRSTSYLHPRVVYGYHVGAKPAGEQVGQVVAPFVKDRLYLGYSEPARAIEIISYNPALGRFEFQKILDFGTPQARLVYAERRQCLACHQNAAPLFSRSNWDETNFNFQTRKKIQTASRPARNADWVYHGVRLEDIGTNNFELSDVQTLDLSIARSFRRHLSLSVPWGELCGRDTSRATKVCRADLFKATLDSICGDHVSGEAAFEAAKAFIRTPGEGGSAERFDTLYPRGLPVLETLIRSVGDEKFRGYFSQGLPDAINPLFRRAVNDFIDKDVYMDSLFVYKTPEEFAFINIANEEWLNSGIDFSATYCRVSGEERHAAIDALVAADNGNGPLSQRGMDRDALLKALGDALNQNATPARIEVPSFLRISANRLPPPASEPEPDFVTITENDPVLMNFAYYCSPCHASGGLPFLRASNKDALTAAIRGLDRARVRALLRVPSANERESTETVMPPRDSPRYSELREHPEARAAMLRFLQ